MEFEYSEKRIRFEKELNELDRITVDFTKILDSLDINYVIVSGYVSILFGRSRSSEDIDLIIEEFDYARFNGLWDNILTEGFECINTFNVRDAYDNYLNSKHAIRFARKGTFDPNMEIKFPKIELERLALAEKIKVVVNDSVLFVSPLELQISFKLSLGSEKDIEDAKHLYNIFEDKLDLELLDGFNSKLKVVELFNKYIRK